MSNIRGSQANIICVKMRVFDFCPRSIATLNST